MSKNKKNLLVSCTSPDNLQRICESTDAIDKNKRYKFTGCFTQCSSKKPGGKIIMNRNKRIYYDDEVLRHLGYLRDQIKENGFLAGELDHPDRFELKLSECSHKITDLWYDPQTQRVMGTLELLDTPRGMIARQLVDAGLKLAVSSRSAGSVRNDQSVELDMMYTWDIVFTPGFQEAHLERVNESLTNSAAKTFLNESLVNSTKEENDIFEISTEAKITEKMQKAMSKPVDMNDLCKPLNEAEEESKKDDAEIVLPEANLNPLAEDGESDDEKKDEKPAEDKESEKDDKSDEDKEKKELTDEEKKERRNLIISVESKEAGKEDEPSEEEKAEKRDKIIDVEAIEKDDKEKSESDEDKEKKDEDKDKKSDDEEANESEDVEECGDDCSEENPTDMKTKDTKASKKDLEDKVLNDCDNKCTDVKEQTEKDMKKISDLLDKAKKKKEVKEQIYRIYPFSVSLSEQNFGSFAALSVADKNKVQKFIVENEIMTIQDINEHWKTPLLVEKRMTKNWLRLASDEDRRLFAAAPMDVQDAIEESAKYVLIRNKQEADEFWDRVGLRRQNAERMINESLNARYSVQKKEDVSETELSAQKCRELGYPANYFKMLEDLY